MKKIDLSYNQLTHLPSCMREMNLKEFQLSGNHSLELPQNATRSPISLSQEDIDALLISTNNES